MDRTCNSNLHCQRGILIAVNGVTAGGGEQGGIVPPTLLTGKFLLTFREKRGKGKKRSKEKRENVKEKKENKKKKIKKKKKEEKIRKNYFVPSEKYSCTKNRFFFFKHF